MQCIECSICSDRFGNDEFNEVIVTACGHVYHKICISKWYHGSQIASKTCPECREPITMESIRRIYFHLSCVADSMQTYVDDLNAEIIAKANKLQLVKLQNKQIKHECTNQIREKDFEIQRLNEKVKKLKLKLKEVKQQKMMSERLNDIQDLTTNDMACRPHAINQLINNRNPDACLQQWNSTSYQYGNQNISQNIMSHNGMASMSNQLTSNENKPSTSDGIAFCRSIANNLNEFNERRNHFQMLQQMINVPQQQTSVMPPNAIAHQSQSQSQNAQMLPPNYQTATMMSNNLVSSFLVASGTTIAQTQNANCNATNLYVQPNPGVAYNQRTNRWEFPH